jgi:hypothetical protein
MDSRDIDPHDAVDQIYRKRNDYAAAKGERIYLEEYRKSLKAILMKESLESAVNAQEREAYSHPKYLQHLKDLKKAVIDEEALRWEMVSAQARIEVWRSQEASARFLDKVTM